MKKTNVSGWVFGALAAVLAAVILAVCMTQRSVPARMLVQPRGAQECIDAMLAHINLGDFSGASEYLYGQPELDAAGERSTEAARQIWNAFALSVRCVPVGECYPGETGICQDVRISGLDIPGITASLKERAQEVLEESVASAGSMEDIYTEDREYRPEFLEQVIREAAAGAIAAGTVQERALTLNLVFDEGRWRIVPDAALLEAISGGILK